MRRPESVLVVVYTVAGQVLLLQRRDDSSFWQSVTGAMDNGEVPRETAQRELLEETGLSCRQLVDCQIINRYPIHANWRHRYRAEVTHNSEHVFLAQFDSAPAVLLNPEEHLDYRWLTVSDAIELMRSPTNRLAVEQLVIPRLPDGC